MTTFNYIIVGVGLASDLIKKGSTSDHSGEVPKGVPPTNTKDGTGYELNGYKPIKGSKNPTGLGGKSFDTEALAATWLAGAEGKAFLNAFINVYVVRVAA